MLATSSSSSNSHQPMGTLSTTPLRREEDSASINVSPQIIYSVVARERVILAEFATCVGNFATITRILLEKISASPGQRKSYTYDNYVFHYVTSSGLTYVCLADRGLGQSMPLKFLDEVCGRFEAAFLTASRAAVALQMNSEFQPVIRSLMEKYAESEDSSSIERIRAHVAEISDNMIENIDKIMQRQEKIELLVEKTETLNRTALQFRRQAVDVRRTLWWRDVRAKIIMVSIALLIIFLLVMWLCGGIQFDKCTSD